MILIDKKQNEKRRRCDACATINKEHYHLQFAHDDAKHASLLTLCAGCLYDLEHKIIGVFKKYKENEDLA